MFKGFQSVNLKTELLELSSGANFMSQDEKIIQFLKSLPLPCAIMGAHDPRALMITQACEEIGLRVPEDIAVLGCNNDSVSCEFSNPPLSSVERDDIQLGFAASAKLDMLLRGEAPNRETLIAPIKVVERQSSCIVNSSSPEMRRALTFINKQIHQSLSVQLICDHLGRSRRWLEYAFREEFGKSPKEFIDELRLQNSRELLLARPDLKLAEIATNCGFASLDQMNQLFTKKLGKRAIFFRK
jgi:LacI family transcriptional regulator